MHDNSVGLGGCLILVKFCTQVRIGSAKPALQPKLKSGGLKWGCSASNCHVAYICGADVRGRRRIPRCRRTPRCGSSWTPLLKCLSRRPRKASPVCNRREASTRSCSSQRWTSTTTSASRAIQWELASCSTLRVTASPCPSAQNSGLSARIGTITFMEHRTYSSYCMLFFCDVFLMAPLFQ